MNVPSVEVIPYTEQYSLTLLKSVIEDPQTHFDNMIILHYIKGYSHKFEFWSNDSGKDNNKNI